MNRKRGVWHVPQTGVAPPKCTQYLRCIGCGRCAIVCGQRATSLIIENIDEAVQKVLGRLKERVNIESASHPGGQKTFGHED